ncbi:hypothetical protein [Pseudoxanthomonas winnipegensis]|uniref:hypothetical protein n=1 Tax=uncultured Pseudoxanthomonas sp. TaxID=281701 RepID=UPI001F33FB96|nr:hypothetical protein [Pseudoxanthomonas winnipegensis]
MDSTTAGTDAASSRKALRVSPRKASGTRSRSVIQGEATASSTPPSTPSRLISDSPEVTTCATWSARPRPSRSATSRVIARPRPRSNRLKYPTTIQAMVSRPKRSTPMWCTSIGTATAASTSGITWPPML